MGTTMIRTSFSPIFNEARDFIVVVLDRHVELLAQVDFVPAMLGSAMHGIPLAVREVGVENLEPGDVIVTNDPYRANNHIPEHVLVKPVFLNGEIVAYTGAIAHMVDVGGTVPAAFGIHENVFQEGLRVPPVKLYRGDRQVDDVFKILLANTRTPNASYGDLKAVVGALYLGERRVLELVGRYGLEAFLEACDDMKRVSEHLMRRQIRRWPNGVYEVEDAFESDGVVPDRPWRLRAKLVVRDDDLIIDFTGSDEPCAGSMALTYGSSSSAGYEAVLQMADGEIPLNDGAYRCITVISPYGTIVNASYPHATMAGNSEGQPHVIDMLLRAFAQFSRDAPAGDGNSNGIVGLGGVDPRTGRTFAYLNIDGTGWGGSAYADGNDVQFCKLANCAIQSVEVMESRYPIVHAEYQLECFRGGGGRHRGGFGSRRRWRVDGEKVVVSATVNRVATPTPPLHGGDPAATNVLLFRRPGATAWETARERFGAHADGMFSNGRLARGEEILVVTANGAGYGDPFERDPGLVLEDYLDELLSAEQARDVFGVVLDEARRAVDVAATRALRETRASR
jgi:N-methylhydantoinase B/oxoprolinase/acetone carboxylase alpha subunit